MIFEELIEPAPANVERLRAQQDAERAGRNEAGLLRWHVQFFGPVVGPQLWAGTLTRFDAWCRHAVRMLTTPSVKWFSLKRMEYRP